MRQTLTEGYAQPPEHQNVPPLYTFTHAPNCFRSLIFGFRKSKSLRIRPLVFQLHAATPLLACKPNAELLFVEDKVNMPDLNLMLPGISNVPKGTK
jgi:hypothetical protein